MRINDTKIRSFVEGLARQPQPHLTDSNVVELLAAVGDGRVSAATMKARLSAPGMTRQAQFELARQGMTANEKRDLATVLDESGLRMDPGARNFLEALVGRAALLSDPTPLTLEQLLSSARPGDVIEAINLSAAPARGHTLEDTVEFAGGDPARFLGELDVRQGDMVRLRKRAADGKSTDWLTVQARRDQDTRAAGLNLSGISLRSSGGGVIVSQAGEGLVSEPGATVRFTNRRTGERIDARISPDGRLPGSLALPGQAGDEFSVSATDGVHNVELSQVQGTLKVPGTPPATATDPGPPPALAATRGYALLAPAEAAELNRRFAYGTPAMRSAATWQLEQLVGSSSFRSAPAAGQAARLRDFIRDDPGLQYLVSTSHDGSATVRRPYQVSAPQAGPAGAFRSQPSASAIRYTVTVGDRSVPVDMPAGGVSGVQSSIHEVARALASLPTASLQQIDRVAVEPGQNPDDAYWEKVYNTPGFRSYMTAGASGVVNIYPTTHTMAQGSIDDSLIHETGHILSKRVYGQWDGSEGWAAWNAAAAADGNAASSYAKASKDEDFAETLTLYMKTRGTPDEASCRALLAHRFAILDRLVGGG